MRRVVGDLEADGLLDEATVIWCGVFKNLDTQEVYKFPPHKVHLIPAFLDKVESLVMHNGIGYDLPLMEKVLGYTYRGNIVDTLLMSRLQRPHRKPPPGSTKGPHSVESWGIRLGRHKPHHDDWSRYSPEMLHRCTEDVLIQAEILKELMREGQGQQWKAAHKNTFKLFGILHKQEQYGWLVDEAHMDRSIAMLTKWMTSIDRVVVPLLPLKCIPPKKVRGNYEYYKKPFTKVGRLQAYVQQYLEDTYGADSSVSVCGPFSKVEFRRVDLNSNTETKDFLLSQGWVPEQWNTGPTGARTSPKLNHNESFSGVEGRVGQVIARRVQCRHRKSQLTGWKKLLRNDSRISQRISGVASTGRLTHTGIVNVPGEEAFFGKRMRACYRAKPGFKIVGVDSAGCQNRMLAARVKDDNFTKALVDGTKEDKTSIHYLNQDSLLRTTGTLFPYKVCKNLNYAFLFGASDSKLAATGNVEPSYGERIRKGLLSVSPGLERLLNDLEKEWLSTAQKRKGRYGVEPYNGYIIGLDGRPVYIEAKHCLLVYMLQSDEALLMQYALVFLSGWLDDHGWKHGVEYGFVANIHDEIQAEVREDLAEAYAKLACAAITYAGEYLKISCPHKGEYQIGNNWSETH